MIFLDNYDLTALGDSKLIAIEHEVKEVLIRFSDKSLETAIKQRKVFSPPHIICFMGVYITFIMMEWMTERQARLHKNELIDFITKETSLVYKKCAKYKPHKKDAAHSERMSLFKEIIRPYSTIAQTSRIERSICNNSVESFRQLKANTIYSSKAKDNMFSFFATFSFVQKEAKKLKQKMRQIIQIDDNTLSGLITKQFARQIAWTTGFFVSLDKKETIENIIECISAVLETLDFNKELIEIAKKQGF